LRDRIKRALTVVSKSGEPKFLQFLELNKEESLWSSASSRQVPAIARGRTASRRDRAVRSVRGGACHPALQARVLPPAAAAMRATGKFRTSCGCDIWLTRRLLN